MADDGAEVIKVEPPEGELNRRIGPERDGVSATPPTPIAARRA